MKKRLFPLASCDSQQMLLTEFLIIFSFPIEAIRFLDRD